jgi:hypothetical protein
MSRLWNTPIFVLATVYFILDGVFLHVTRPIAEWLSRKKLLERARRWVTSLGPYGALALFAIPVIVMEPAKPLSAYLLATGHFFWGAVIFITAEVIKLTVVERLFQLNKRKLLSIPLFAWGYGYWRRVMNFLESTAAWQASQQMVRAAADWIRHQRQHFQLLQRRVQRQR